MNNEDIHHTLRDALHELQRIRRENEILRAKVEMIELLDRVLCSEPPRRSMIMSPDVAFPLGRLVEDFEKLAKKDKGIVGQ